MLRNRYAYFSVGSDQIWNSNLDFGYGTEFLDFAAPEQRLTLSPSFGTIQVADDKKASFIKGLRGFEYLSVREESGAKLIHELTGQNAEVIVDPTMMLMCIGLLSKTAEEKCEFEFDNEVRNMEKALLVVKQVAERHNVVVNNCLETILPNFPSWAKGFRKKNSIKLKIGKLKRSISGIVAKSKVKTSYEYQLDKE